MRFKLLVVLFALAGCASSSSSIDNATLEVISDCTTPVTDVVIKTLNGNSVSGIDFATIGFPTATVHLGQDNAGTMTVNGVSVSRSCTQTYGANDTSKNNKYIYSCFDDGVYECSITLIRQ